MNEQLMADSNIKSFVEAINSLKEMDEELFTKEEYEIEDDIIISILENTNEIIDMILKRKFKKIYK